jgi:hypothetical protein
MVRSSVRLVLDFCSEMLGVALHTRSGVEPVFIVEARGSSLGRVTRMLKRALEHEGVGVRDLHEVVLATGPGRLMGIKVSHAFAYGLKEATSQVALYGLNRLDALSTLLPSDLGGWVVLGSHGKAAIACGYTPSGGALLRRADPVVELKEKLLELVGQEPCVSDLCDFGRLPRVSVLEPEEVTRIILRRLVSVEDCALYFSKDPEPCFFRPFMSLGQSGKERVVF